MTSFCLDEFNVFWVSGSKDSGTAELKDAFDLQMTTLTMPFDYVDALMRPSMTTRVQHSLGHPPPQRSTPLRPLNPIPFWRNPLPMGIFAHDAFKSFVEALEKRDGGVLPADLSGLSVIDSYQLLQQGRELTEDETFLASALGWCIEWLQAFFLVLDNIMDGSHTRRGQPCWFRLPKVSMIAVNDGVVLRNHIPRILIKYFREKPYYVDLLDLFNESLRRDLKASWSWQLKGLSFMCLLIGDSNDKTIGFAAVAASTSSTSSSPLLQRLRDHRYEQAQENDAVIAVLCGCARSVAVLGGGATDAQWLCSVAVQRVCSGYARWLGSVAMLWVLAGSDVKVTSTSSVSCLAASNNFKDRCQTTSRPRSSSSSSSSKFVFVLPCKFPSPSS
ncbi:hypothetical protein EV1_023504 [Malus domestica]